MVDERFLSISSVDRVFDGKHAVKGFELDVREGEFVSLLGPSGCGKTTLLRIVAGLDFPDAGRVVLEGRDITDLPANRRPVNLVFQRVTLFPHLNVRENVAFGLRLRGMPWREVDPLVSRYLDLVRLPGFEGRDVATLSGGEAQRVALARALVNGPRVLLLDEPLAALDLQIRRQIQTELKDIHKTLGITFIYVTHDQEEAMRLSDRVVIMSEGSIEQVGSPRDIYARPASAFAAGFIGTSNLWEATIVEAGAGGVVLDLAGTRIRVSPVDGGAPGSTVWLLLRPEALSLEPVDQATERPGASLRGRVVDVSFLGAVVHYRVGVADRELLVSRSLEHGRPVSEGEEVLVSWDPDHATVLAR
jgi:ABC-type Fe3+/spermidine/putrescine transport system ATPase subunit